MTSAIISRFAGYILLALTAFVLSSPAIADARNASGETKYIMPEKVLAASAAHFPQVLESLAARRAAASDITRAQGAFDLVFSAESTDRLSGFWDGRIVETNVKRNIRPLGGSVYGGYRISDGRFPIYEDVNFTNTGGEFKIGALFSLLRDRSIDERRFRENDATLALEKADLELFLTRIGVQHRALAAYWRWVAAGRQRAVYEDLLRLAEAREGGLEKQVRSGALAAIFLTENKQNIIRRRRLVAEAERDFLSAANALSFYLRDANGDPVAPSEEALPPPDVLENVAALGVEAGDDILAGLTARPELGLLQVALERAQGRMALSRNNLQPKLDVKAEVSTDLGAVAEGGPSRDSTDAVLGLRFSVPLQRRNAKGALERAKAERDALVQRRRQTADEIEIELRNILVDLSMSQQLAVIAEQEVTQAKIMRDAERKRFTAGASDFFLLNIREETAADARARFYIADIETRLARLNYDAAVMDLKRLGLESDQVSY